MANSSTNRHRNPNSRGRKSPSRSKSAALPLNRSLTSRRREHRSAHKTAKAEYLASLPKDPWKRLAARLRPKHLVDYWFSRDGLIMTLKVIGIGIVACFFLTIGLFAYFRKDLPSLKDISGQNIGGSIDYYDRTGKVLLWQDYSNVKRIPVPSNQIATYMKQATVAIEDKGFYTEGAFDIRGILRAAFHDVIHGGSGLQGGSTITQQLVKLNEGWTDNRTITRKIKELILAVEVERKYTKDQILTGYLNIAPYGGIEYGVEAAAEDYFHTTAAKLDLAQSAMLAAIPQAPSYYSPYASTQWNPEAGNTFSAGSLIGRQQYILNLMVQQHYISLAQANAAEQENVLAEVQPLQSKYQNIQAPYFVQVAKLQLERMYGTATVNSGGWKVITTLNLQLQNYAEQDIANNVARVAATGGDDEAMVGEDVKTGQVLMLVGGENYNNPQYGQINYANTNILPGSSVKPFVYSTLINNNTNVGAGSVLYDTQQPINVPGAQYYPCTNKTKPNAITGYNGANCLWDYDFRYPGAESIRYALAGSRNVPAVKAVLSEDPTDNSQGHVASINLFIKTFDGMVGDSNGLKCFVSGANILTAGTSQEDQCGASAGIGDGAYDHIDEQVNGDATLARLGQELPQTYILQVINSSGKTIYQWKQPKPTQVIRTDAAYIIDNILSDPRATYLPGSCSATNCTQLYAGGYKFQRYNGWDIAIKTGTQADNFDGLMTAWDTQFAAVSWVGYHNEDRSLAEGQMEYITEPLTRTWMEQALSSLNTKPVNWTQPSDIKTLPAYVQRTHVGLGSEEPGPSTDLFPSWYKGKGSTTGSETIDKVSGLLATSCTPPDAKENVSGANDSSFSVDIFYPTFVGNESALINSGSNNNAPSQFDNIHNCNDQPPQLTLTAPSSPAVCSNTDNNSQGCAITVTATQGTHPLGGSNFGGTIDVSINGIVMQSFNVTNSPATVTYYYSPTSTGNVTVSATVTDSVLYQASQSAQIQTVFTPVTTNGGTTTNGSNNSNSNTNNSGSGNNGNGGGNTKN